MKIYFPLGLLKYFRFFFKQYQIITSFLLSNENICWIIKLRLSDFELLVRKNNQCKYFDRHFLKLFSDILKTKRVKRSSVRPMMRLDRIILKWRTVSIFPAQCWIHSR